MAEHTLNEQEKQEARKLEREVAESLGKRADVSLDRLLEVIEFQSIFADVPKLLPQDDALEVAMFVNSQGLRGKYIARLKGKELKIFGIRYEDRARHEDLLEEYCDEKVERTYSCIMGIFYPERK